MRLLPKRAEEPADEPAAPAVEPAVGADRVVAPKGRPTPKRRDSEVRRGPVTAPKTRKEAAQRQKAQAKRPADTPGQRRQQMLAGDPAALSRRDAGPLRALARDYVDTRRMLSNYLLIFFPLLLLTFVVRSPLITYFVYAFLLVVFFEWMMTGRRLMKIASERGIDTGRNKVMGIGFYAGSRAYLPRNWRVPRPRLAFGDSY